MSKAAASAGRTAPKPRNPQVAPSRAASAKPPALAPRNPRPVPKDDPIKVRATETGYYDHVRRREGDVFTIANEKAFSSRWMERVDARVPERVSTANQAIKRAHDDTLALHTQADGDGGTATGDQDVLGED